MLDWANGNGQAPPGDRLTLHRQQSGDPVAAYFHTGGTTRQCQVAQHSYGGNDLQRAGSGTRSLFTEKGQRDCTPAAVRTSLPAM